MAYPLKTRRNQKRIDREVVTQTRAPLATDSSADNQNISRGTIWVNSTTGALYVCTDPTPGAAVWVEKGGAVSGGVTLTENTLYYVDFDLADDTGNDGSASSPFMSLENAFNQRDTDAAEFAVIKCYGRLGENDVAQADIIPAGTALTLVDLSEAAATTAGKNADVQILDRDSLYIQGYTDHLSSIDFNVTQTGVNDVYVVFTNCVRPELYVTAAADASYIQVEFYNCPQAIVGSQVNAILGYGSNLDVTPPITDLFMYNSAVLVDTTGSTINTDFQSSELKVDNGVTFTSTGSHVNLGGALVEVGTGSYVISGTKNISGNQAPFV
jgi:hypothetical protein